MTDTQPTGYPLARFSAAQAACPTGPANFAAGFIGALSVSFSDDGRLDKTVWDRAIRISTETAARLHADRRLAP